MKERGMQSGEAKGFFFNTALKRPAILRGFLRGWIARHEESGPDEARKMGVDTLAEGSTPRDAHPREERALKRICGL